MQIDWTQTLLFPIIVGLTLLCVEYFGIQPLLRSKETKVQQLSGAEVDNGNRKWGDGIKNAIMHFKKFPNPYKWTGFSVKQNFISIIQVNISKGQAELTLAVTERYILDFGKPKEIAYYVLLIDRLGDIYKYDQLSSGEADFESGSLPFPKSWIIIGIILFITVYLQLSKTPEGDDVVNGHLVSSLWAEASPITSNFSVNGSLGTNEINSYLFKSETGEVVTFRVKPVDRFLYRLSIYSANNSLVRRIDNSNYYVEDFYINFAPEINTNYLILVYPYASTGGSYTLSVNIASQSESP